MFKWKKLGQIFDPTKLPTDFWMNEYAQAPSVVIYDDHIRVFFSSRALPTDNGMYVSRLGYLDLKHNDLLSPTSLSPAPILPLGKIGTFDEFGTYPASIIQDGELLKAYYAGWTRCESVPFNAAIGLAVSKDQGKSFQRVGEGPILSYTPDEPFVLGSPKIRRFNNIWYLWYSAGKKWVNNTGKPEPVYKIRMAKSTDGIHWEKIGVDIIDSILEYDECQASPDVTYHNGLYHMFFSYRHNLNFRDKDRGYRIGYASSKDLIHWDRDDSKAGIKTSSTGWDSESVSYAHLFQLNSDIFMLYQGNEIGKFGFGLAKLEKYTV